MRVERRLWKGGRTEEGAGEGMEGLGKKWGWGDRTDYLERRGVGVE